MIIQVDTSGLTQHIQQFYRALTPALEALGRTAIGMFGKRVLRFIDPQGPAAGKFSDSDRVGSQRGRLAEAFQPGGSTNISSVKASQNGLTFDSRPDLEKVPYYTTQEWGGFIEHQGRMPGFLFARFKETGIRGFLYMALSARKHGGITIKARPSFTPAIAEFKQQDLPAITRDAQITFGRLWNV